MNVLPTQESPVCGIPYDFFSLFLLEIELILIYSVLNDSQMPDLLHNNVVVKRR
ncbi:hypothetical protein L218DRAFT_964267 [Marasmius fiardii PR-910]|nr:hypothetical protein L218DRAFT_964267 [Marasmius fiardii PR-910]